MCVCVCGSVCFGQLLRSVAADGSGPGALVKPYLEDGGPGESFSRYVCSVTRWVHSVTCVCCRSCRSSSRLRGSAGPGGAPEPSGLQLQRLGSARIPPQPPTGPEPAGDPVPAQQVRNQNRVLTQNQNRTQIRFCHGANSPPPQGVPPGCSR